MSNDSLLDRIDALVRDARSASDRRAYVEQAVTRLLEGVEPPDREWAIDLLQDAAVALGLDDEPAGMLRLYAARGQSHFESAEQELPGPYPAFWWIEFTSPIDRDKFAHIARGGGGPGWSFGLLQSLDRFWLSDARGDATEAERQRTYDDFVARMASLGLAIQRSHRVVVP